MNQTKIPGILAKINSETQRYDAICTLGHKTEKDALQAATHWLTQATMAEIIAAIEDIQTVKGKRYQKEPQYARINDTLHQSRITKGELARWHQECLKTTFSSGNRYQPLPTHDEAWQIYSRIHTETSAERFASESLKYRIPPVKITNEELESAARAGFFSDMPRSLQRRLFLLLPTEKRQHITETTRTPGEALEETKTWYETKQWKS